MFRALLLLAMAGTALLGCSRDGPGAAGATKPKEQPAVRITAAPVEARAVQRTVELTGTLKPEDEVTLSNESAGLVEKVLVDLGDRVQPGQVLVQLDPREAQFAAEQAQAKLAAARKAVDRAKAALNMSQANVVRQQATLELARTNRQRFEELFKDGAVAASQRDAAVTEAEVAQATLRLAEAQVDSDREALAAAEANVAQVQAALEMATKRRGDTEIRSPTAGEVQKRLVSPGESVKERTPLLVIVRTASLKLSSEIPERFAPQVRPGQAVRVVSAASPGKIFTGRVTRIAPAVTVETRSFAIEAMVPNADGALKAGAFAKAEVLVRQDAGIPFIPEEAVVSLAGITKVFVVSDGKVAERAVRLGLRQDGMVEVLEGTRAGEQVARSNLGQLAEGRTVVVEQAK
ncbi:MAG: efflux RND transporter periplasmic adaptor subunit [candidate division NC10 bacterium]|nr:efflux RND transporter periplasmic adaptor subunit [candidate division NC10 bacterium]